MLDDEPASEDEEAPHVPDQPSEPTWLPSRRVRSKRGPLPFDQRPDGSIFGPAPVSEYGGDSVFPPAHETLRVVHTLDVMAPVHLMDLCLPQLLEF